MKKKQQQQQSGLKHSLQYPPYPEVTLLWERGGKEVLTAQVAQARNVSIGEHRHPSYGCLSI